MKTLLRVWSLAFLLGCLAPLKSATAEITFGPWSFDDDAFADDAAQLDVGSVYLLCANDVQDALVGFSPTKQIANIGNNGNANLYQLTFTDQLIADIPGDDIVLFDSFGADSYLIAVRPLGGTWTDFVVYPAEEFANTGAITDCIVGYPGIIFGLAFDLQDFGLPADSVADAIKISALPAYEQLQPEGDPVMAAVLSQVTSDPQFDLPVTCGELFQADVGFEIVLVVSASDPDNLDQVTLTATGVPLAASLDPPFPITANPVSSTFTWTPQIADLGTHTVTFRATDVQGHILSCPISFEVVGQPLPPQKILHVNDDAVGQSNGTSWRDAYPDLQLALAAASAGDHLWVAEGIYRPSDCGGEVCSSIHQEKSFELKTGVAVYGGFQGMETSLEQRPGSIEQTILSGNLPASDCCEPHDTSGCEDAKCAATVCALWPACCDAVWEDLCVALADFLCTAICPARQSYHVVRASSVDDAILDGFTITGGRANVIIDHSEGGGLLCTDASLTVKNCRFESNFASVGGGGISMNGCVTTIEDTCFTANQSQSSGGAVDMGVGSAEISRCRFVDNNATDGGAARLANATITDCEFVGNSAGSGGAITGIVNASNCTFFQNTASDDGGAVYSSSFATLANCVFSGNEAGDRGGGIYVLSAEPKLNNCTFVGNHAGFSAGGGVLQDGCCFLGPMTVANCLFWMNSSGLGTDEAAQISFQGVQPPMPNVSYSLIQGLKLYAGNGNIDSEPVFVDADGVDGVPGTDDDDLRLASGSPAIDAGLNFALPPDLADLDQDGDLEEPLPVDADGLARVVDDLNTNHGTLGALVDIGAHEYQVLEPCVADLTGDGAVGSADLALLLGSWGMCPICNCLPDLNGDSVVNPFDLALLLGAWGLCE